MIAAIDQIDNDRYRGLFRLAFWPEVTFNGGIAKKGAWLQLFST